MCGICGIVSDCPHTGLPEIVSKMNAALYHRGPDGSGRYNGKGVSIAMRRLAIIDLYGGDQPIFNETNDIGIVCNGEIYNYKDLTVDLKKKGHEFKTKSDIEVILHLYEENGFLTPIALKGMFAFCIFDLRNRKYFFARDRFGEKPLYYYFSPQKVLTFSSEIKSIIECPFVPRKIDLEALSYYLKTGLVPAPLSMFKELKILEPGHYLYLHNGNLTKKAYFEPDFKSDDYLNDESNAIEAVRESLQKAVSRQSVSDVPIGAFLSGGIDSSSIVSMLHSCSNQPINTFTIKFQDPKYDESPIARSVAKYLHTNHKEYTVQNVSFEEEDLWRIVDHIGTPFYDSSAIPTYILSKHVAEDIKVVLSGDGGDELFGGYRFFNWGLTIAKIDRIPRLIRTMATSAVRNLSKNYLFSGASYLRRIRKGLEASLVSHELMPVYIGFLFDINELIILIKERNLIEETKGNMHLITKMPDSSQYWSSLRKLMYYRIKNNLASDMLTKVDRMSMACSLEVRAPMLDPDLAELTMRLPDKYLINNGIRKYILRKAMYKKMPDEVFTHPKHGFGIPLHRFQNRTYRNLAYDLISIKEFGHLFHEKTLQKVTKFGLSRKSDHSDLSVFRASHQLWSLMQLSAWIQRFNISL
jgi:asparagine synthase (glutamine-hydrolysing)